MKNPFSVFKNIRKLRCLICCHQKKKNLKKRMDWDKCEEKNFASICWWLLGIWEFWPPGGATYNTSLTKPMKPRRPKRQRRPRSLRRPGRNGSLRRPGRPRKTRRPRRPKRQRRPRRSGSLKRPGRPRKTRTPRWPRRQRRPRRPGSLRRTGRPSFYQLIFYQGAGGW